MSHDAISMPATRYPIRVAIHILYSREILAGRKFGEFDK